MNRFTMRPARYHYYVQRQCAPRFWKGRNGKCYASPSASSRYYVQLRSPAKQANYGFAGVWLDFENCVEFSRPFRYRDAQNTWRKAPVTRAVNWYDVVVFVALLYGVWSGLRAGLMGEIIRVIGLVLMIALAFVLYRPVGDWIGDHSQWSDETAHLIAFVSIAVIVYLISLAVRLATHRHMQQMKLAALVENIGGAFAGVVRMTLIMAWLTVVLSLSGNEFFQRSVGRESRFGSLVVEQLPALKSTVEKSLPKKLWIEDIKQPAEPHHEDAGATNSDTTTNHPQPNAP